MTSKSYKIIQDIPPSIFRAYDVRGIVGDVLTPDVIYTIGLAIGSEAQQRNENTIAMARDGRLSSPELSLALSEGLRDTGCHVIDVGAVPTPLLYFATHTLENTASGVMLTGSHNAAEYNGIKMVIAGQTLSGQDIQQLYQRIQRRSFAQGRGTLQTHEIVPDYIRRITDDVKLSRPLKIVIDSGNGIAGRIAPTLFRALSCEVIELFCEVDGRFPNHHPDPAEPKNLQALIDTVQKQQADIGLAFDGDGDRLGVVTNQGEIIWPDRQMMLFAKDILSRHPGATIIYDVKSSRHLGLVIQAQGGVPLMYKTGHSLIKAKLQETGALLAGEMSGHIFFKERWFGFDDALYSGARLLEILSQQQQDVEAVFNALPNSLNTPELKLPLPEEHKFSFMEILTQQACFEDAIVTTIDGLRVEFADGWGLIRPSNTTPCLVLRFEAETQDSLMRIQAIFRDQILAVDDRLVLPF